MYIIIIINYRSLVQMEYNDIVLYQNVTTLVHGAHKLILTLKYENCI